MGLGPCHEVLAIIDLTVYRVTLCCITLDVDRLDCVCAQMDCLDLNSSEIGDFTYLRVEIRVSEIYIYVTISYHRVIDYS